MPILAVGREPNEPQRLTSRVISSLTELLRSQQDDAHNAAPQKGSVSGSCYYCYSTCLLQLFEGSIPTSRPLALVGLRPTFGCSYCPRPSSEGSPCACPSSPAPQLAARRWAPDNTPPSPGAELEAQGQRSNCRLKPLDLAPASWPSDQSKEKQAPRPIRSGSGRQCPPPQGALTLHWVCPSADPKLSHLEESEANQSAVQPQPG